MSDLALSFDTFTYKDYKDWPEDFRCELIDGVVYMMPAPLIWHQEIVTELGFQLRGFFKGKPCRALVAPVDVRLFPQTDDSDDVVVQPDLVVICDEAKLSDGKACRGAPDLVIEILSESTKSHDLRLKLDLYKKAGVREYWTVGSDAVKVCQFKPEFIEIISDLKEINEVKSRIFSDLALKF